jgi:hypothetical protein
MLTEDYCRFLRQSYDKRAVLGRNAVAEPKVLMND